MAAAKFDVQTEVTKSIIAAIEAGCPPWRKPWTGDKGGAAMPLRSNGEPYRGINVILLWCRAAEMGYTSAHWFTFNQAKDMGAFVKKGEKCVTVVKYGTVEKETDEGKERRFSYAKAYRVFNADQIEGLPAEFYGQPSEAPRDLGTEATPELDAFFAATGAKIAQNPDDPRAYYAPATDSINMPMIGTFESASRFYGVLGHELCHWTGAQSRLDRFSQARTKNTYGFEELVAEIGSAMVSVQLGVEPDFEQSAAYVKLWLEAIKGDKGLIFKAATEAQKAADFIFEAASRKEEKLAA
ncbi:zincin-like metallopeptidase domain-containing protein [Cereibacter sp. SYSU M97828]|nr:zincin-like metallopeptidase domain-containing protein [Cereibacter flavus]